MTDHIIRQFTLRLGDNEIELPFLSRVLSVSFVRFQCGLWALCPTNANDVTVHRFHVVPDGVAPNADLSNAEFIGTAVSNPYTLHALDGSVVGGSVDVWHVFELERRA